MIAIDNCRHCGKPESEHHEFVPWKRVPGCKCNPRDWRSWPAPTPCRAYAIDPGNLGLCRECEHPVECHARQPTDGATVGEKSPK